MLPAYRAKILAMRMLNLSCRLSILFLLLFCACTKSDLPEPTIIPLPEHPVHLKYVNASGNFPCEYIITDSNGIYLLDTILPAYQLLSTKLLSNQSKFNITTIEFREGIPSPFIVNTYYQVELKAWNINQQFQMMQFGPQDQSFQSTITYLNAPVSGPQGRVPVYSNTSGLYEFGVNKNFELFYKQPDPFTSYVVFPEQKLYLFHQTITNNDTVNLAAKILDTAFARSFTKPFQSSLAINDLVGYRKKDDRSTFIKLWENVLEVGDINKPEFIYPGKGVEEYLVRQLLYESNSDAQHYSQELSDTMPASLFFFSQGSFKVTKPDPSTYLIDFPQGDPTLYTVRITNNVMAWTISAPPSRKHITDTDKLIDLGKAKLFKGVNVLDAKPVSIELIKANNYTYQEYLNVVFNAAGPATPAEVKTYTSMSSAKGL